GGRRPDAPLQPVGSLPQRPRTAPRPRPDPRRLFQPRRDGAVRADLRLAPPRARPLLAAGGFRVVPRVPGPRRWNLPRPRRLDAQVDHERGPDGEVFERPDDSRVCGGNLGADAGRNVAQTTQFLRGGRASLSRPRPSLCTIWADRWPDVDQILIA